MHVNAKMGAAVQAEKVQRLDIDGLVTAMPLTDMALIKLLNVQDVPVHACWLFKGTKIFADVRGTETKNIKFQHNEPVALW